MSCPYIFALRPRHHPMHEDCRPSLTGHHQSPHPQSARRLRHVLAPPCPGLVRLVPLPGQCLPPLSQEAHPQSHRDWVQVQGLQQRPAWQPTRPSVPAAFGCSQGLCPRPRQPWRGLGGQQGPQAAVAAGTPAPGVLAAAAAGVSPSQPVASWPCELGHPGHQGWVAGVAPSGRGPGRTAVWGPRGSWDSAGWRGAGAAWLRLKAGGACQQVSPPSHAGHGEAAAGVQLISVFAET